MMAFDPVNNRDHGDSHGNSEKSHVGYEASKEPKTGVRQQTEGHAGQNAVNDAYCAGNRPDSIHDRSVHRPNIP